MNELLLFNCWVSKCKETTHALISDRRGRYCYGCFDHAIDIIRFIKHFGRIPPMNISEDELKDLSLRKAYRDVAAEAGAIEELPAE